MSDQPDSTGKHDSPKRLEDARSAYLDFARRHPGNVQVLHALGLVCYQLGRIPESIEHLERARAIAPDDAGICFSLGALYAEHGDKGKAIERYTESLRLKPDNDEAWSNLGIVHYELLNYGASVECLEKAVAINAGNEKAFYNLGLALMAVGKSVEADRMFRAARDIAPDNNAISSCLLFNLHNLAAPTNREIADEHRRWGSRFDGLSHPGSTQVLPGRDGGKIRVGYVSPDFRWHSVFFFINPVLRAHDRATVECYGYSDVLRPDDATLQLKHAADHWRDISRLSDEQVLSLIRDDAIDILVDLAGHTARNRLPVFAARAAPVQVSWLGYPDTTGLRAMDFRLTDDRVDPVGEADALCTETLVRLEGGFVCYAPPANAPSPGGALMLANGFATFGSFNNLAKVTDQVIRAWSAILHRVPGARLILKAKGLGDASVRARVLSEFQGHGIDGDRVECHGHIVAIDRHFDMYRRIDIALDTFPYNGTTTTCEALWMGVPVVTWAGDRHVSRVGRSLLTTVGLADCVAESEDAYIELAVALAGDVARFASLRTGLRDRMRASPLMDAAGFTRILESHFRRFARSG